MPWIASPLTGLHQPASGSGASQKRSTRRPCLAVLVPVHAQGRPCVCHISARCRCAPDDPTGEAL